MKLCQYMKKRQTPITYPFCYTTFQIVATSVVYSGKVIIYM